MPLQVVKTSKYSVFEVTALTALSTPLSSSKGTSSAQAKPGAAKHASTSRNGKLATTTSTTATAACTTTMDTEGAILNALTAASDTSIADSHEWATSQGLDPQAVVGAIKSLSADDYVAVADLQTSSLEFTAEGKQVLAEGSPEFRVWSVLAERGSLSMPDLQAAVGKDAAKIGMGNAMKSRWIRKEGGNLFPAAESVTDEVRQQLQAIQQAQFAMNAVDAKVRGVGRT